MQNLALPEIQMENDASADYSFQRSINLDVSWNLGGIEFNYIEGEPIPATV